MPYADLRPEDHMTFWKQRKVRRLAEYYLAAKKKTGVPWQIDLVAVEVDGEAVSDVRHLERVG